jgi:hypothetical protein
LIYELQLADGRNRFHMGEPIPIRMCFSSSRPDSYLLDNAQYDRSGRTPADRFLVTPSTGHVDPLAEHFQTGILVAWTGGLRGEQLLGKDPTCIDAFLNEWVRFDAPGRYEVVARSYRIRKEVDGAPEPRTEQVDVTSTQLRIEIAPLSAPWAQQELERIRTGSEPLGSNPVNSAMRLRFLGTPAALVELTRRLGEGDNGALDCAFGIIGPRIAARRSRQRSEPSQTRPYPSPARW